MDNKAALLEVTDKFAFTLLMEKSEFGHWEGRVFRFPRPDGITTDWGKDCGSVTADSKEELRLKLDEIIEQWK